MKKLIISALLTTVCIANIATAAQTQVIKSTTKMMFEPRDWVSNNQNDITTILAGDDVYHDVQIAVEPSFDADGYRVSSIVVHGCAAAPITVKAGSAVICHLTANKTIEFSSATNQKSWGKYHIQ